MVTHSDRAYQMVHSGTMSLTSDFPISDDGLKQSFAFLRDAAETLGLSEALLHRLCVIVDEYCANMIRHDQNLAETDRFSIDLSPQNSGVVMLLSDPGTMFDPTTFSFRSAPKVGGHGIALMKGLALNWDYSRQDELNCLRITMMG